MENSVNPRELVNEQFVSIFKQLETNGAITKGAHGGNNRRWVAHKLDTEVHVLNDYLRGKRFIPLIRALHFCDLFQVSRDLIWSVIPKLGVEEVFDSNIKALQSIPDRMKVLYSNTPLRARPASGATDDFGDIETSIEAFQFPGLGNQVYAFTIAGDSMEPRFMDGDMVIASKVDDYHDVKSNGFYVVHTQKGIYLKSVEKLYNEEDILTGFQLHSINSEYPPFTVSSEDVNSFLHVKKRITDMF